jgi:tetratricopeptide (TPR) repeat protein
MMQHRAAEAVVLAQQIVNINPASLDNQWQLSVVYQQSGNITQAIAITEQLLDKDYQFSSLQALTWVLDYYAKQNNWTRATQVAEKMVKIEPNNKDVYIALTEVYFQSGQKDKARDLAEKLLKADKDLYPKLEKYLQK